MFRENLFLIHSFISEACVIKGWIRNRGPRGEDMSMSGERKKDNRARDREYIAHAGRSQTEPDRAWEREGKDETKQAAKR